MLTTLLFDLDGTLIDSVADLHAAAVLMLGELGRPPVSLQQLTGFVGNGVNALVERCLMATGGAEGLREAVHRFEQHYGAAPAKSSKPYPGVASALGSLRAAGLKLGVCTNKPQALAERILRELNLLTLFGAVVGGGAARPLKPDPASLHACRRLLAGEENETLHVGDSEIDEEAAHRAGLPFALFSGGYRQKDAIAMRTVFVFDRYEELASWVLAQRQPARDPQLGGNQGPAA